MNIVNLRCLLSDTSLSAFFFVLATADAVGNTTGFLTSSVLLLLLLLKKDVMSVCPARFFWYVRIISPNKFFPGSSMNNSNKD